MSITTRRILECKSHLIVISVIKIFGVSCNYNFGNTKKKYICLKIPQVYCSIPYWHRDNFKSVVRTLVITGLKEIPNRTACFGVFFKFYIKNFFRTLRILNFFLTFCNLLIQRNCCVREGIRCVRGNSKQLVTERMENFA